MRNIKTMGPAAIFAIAAIAAPFSHPAAQAADDADPLVQSLMQGPKENKERVKSKPVSGVDLGRVNSGVLLKKEKSSSKLRQRAALRKMGPLQSQQAKSLASLGIED